MFNCLKIGNKVLNYEKLEGCERAWAGLAGRDLSCGEAGQQHCSLPGI